MMYLNTLYGITRFDPHILLNQMFAFIFGIFPFIFLSAYAVAACRALIILVFFHLSCINQAHYIHITNNMHFVTNDVYITKIKCILLAFCLLQKTVCLCSCHSHPLNSGIQNAWSYISTSNFINDGVIN